MILVSNNKNRDTGGVGLEDNKSIKIEIQDIKELNINNYKKGYTLAI